MICSLSGETPEEPVVSLKSGHVFEKRLIEKYLETNNGICPATQQPLTKEDLLPVKVNKVVKPRPTTATSIPATLQIFQNEWDALMLETYTLKQQLDSVRQELSHALYQHDAACRVIARLIKERDDARNALATLKSSGRVGGGSDADSMDVDSTSSFRGISEDIQTKLIQKSQELSKDRRKRTTSPTLATAEDIKSYQVTSSHNTHSSSAPGVLCVDIHPTQQNLILTGGVDAAAIVFDLSSKKIVRSFKEHKSKINDVLFHPTQDLLFTCSADNLAKVWSGSDEKSVHTVKTHQGSVVGCTLHPTGDYWVTASQDQTWAFHDIAASTCVAQVGIERSIEEVQFHPDGLILGLGTTDGAVKIWDVKSQKEAATFPGHKGAISGISFSENGYYLATSAEDNTIRLWDLRKAKSIHTITLPDNFAASSVQFDYSGTYLAASGSEIRVFMGKTLNHIASFTKHTNTVTDVTWGKDAQFLVSVSLDRSTKVWGKSS